MAPRCSAPSRPRTNAVVALEKVFPNVAIEGAVALARAPGVSERWHAVAKAGVVYTFADEDDAQPAVFLDISQRVEEASEAGLLGIAFHPEFPVDGRVFLHYNAPGGSAFLSRVSSFVSEDGGITARAGSESVVLEVDQPFSNHNGADIGFGPDGYLYFGLGDGGSAGDPLGSGQDTETLLGSMLRVDIDNAQPYEIPPDNPFADGGGRPEIFAWGFRNPYRWSFDRETGALWAGDVGQHAWEEVNRVERGGNYGWNVREGTDCLSADECERDGFVEPVAQYRNTGTASVVAGYVYRGSAIPNLVGTFVYNDFYFGSLFGVAAEGGEPRILGEGARGIGGWAESASGELFGIDFFDGSIYALVASEPPPEGPDPFPRLLSETGCVALAAPEAPAGDALPYAVNVAFWSDGAEKARFLAMPEGTAAQLADDGDIALPVGAVLVKTFFDEGRPIETRLLVHHEDEAWAGYGYAWDDASKDAVYVEETRTEMVGGRPWVFPATRDCESCHTKAAGYSLGPELSQLRSEDLEAWVDRGWLEDAVPAAPLSTTDVRAYLHVNCSPCHRDEGTGGRSTLDLRASVPLSDTGLCGAPRAGELGLATPRIVAPGEPARSVLLARMRADQSARMPPVGTATPDVAGAALVERWIADLNDCP